MSSNRFVLAALGLACILAAAGGGYFASRQNATSQPLATQAGRRRGTPHRGAVSARRDPRRHVALVLRDLSDGSDTRRHLLHREALGKDDVEWLRHRDHGDGLLAVRRSRDRAVDEGASRAFRGSGLRLRAASSDRCDREPPEAAEREHEQDERDDAPPRALAARGSRARRRAGLRGDHARAPLDHAR